MRRHRLVFLVMLAGLASCDGSRGSPDARRVEASPPETLFAVRDHRTEIVEVHTATGRVERTVVDLGYTEPPGDSGSDSNTYIESIDLSPDRRALY